MPTSSGPNRSAWVRSTLVRSTATRTLLIIVLLITHVSPTASECWALSRPPSVAESKLPSEFKYAGYQNVVDNWKRANSLWLRLSCQSTKPIGCPLPGRLVRHFACDLSGVLHGGRVVRI